MKYISLKYLIGRHDIFIHCPTLEEAQMMNKLLQEEGASGFSKENIVEYWNRYKQYFVISVKTMSSFADITFAKKHEYSILPCSEFLVLQPEAPILEPIINNSYSIF